MPAGLNFWKTGIWKIFCIAEEQLRLRSTSVQQKRLSHATVSSGSHDFTNNKPHHYEKRREAIWWDKQGNSRGSLRYTPWHHYFIPTNKANTRGSSAFGRCIARPNLPRCPNEAPIVSTRCCKSLLCFQACKEAYVQHPLDRICPLCLQSSKPSVFRGLDEFLMEVAGLM